MELDNVVQMLKDLSEDNSVPKNIRKSTAEAAERLMDDSKGLSVRINAVVSILDEISNDPNLPVHARTEMWKVASSLETWFLSFATCLDTLSTRARYWARPSRPSFRCSTA